VIVSFPDPNIGGQFLTAELNTVTGGSMSTYSTWGPTNENLLKPVVSAPGGSILSTYPTFAGSYAVESGTSMSAPFVAGVVALYLQVKGKGISPKVINAALASTAKPLNFNDGISTFSYLTSIAQQGGGLIDAYQMVHAGITVSETNLAFNDTANHVQDHAFYVENIGDTPATYTLTHAPAANVYAFEPSYTLGLANFPMPMDIKYASVVISSSTLSLKPGQKKRVFITAVPDPSLDSTLVPFYSGFINIDGGGETIRKLLA
jgi:subtilisin family serine protease